MNNKEKLINYYENLFNILNQNGYRQKFKWSDKEIEYSVETEELNLNQTTLTNDPSAFNFLKANNHIRKDICHKCGESPIDGSYTFTEPFHKIKLNICKNCFALGKRIQGKPVNLVEKNSGCLIILSVFLTVLIFTGVTLFNQLS